MSKQTNNQAPVIVISADAQGYVATSVEKFELSESSRRESASAIGEALKPYAANAQTGLDGSFPHWEAVRIAFMRALTAKRTGKPCDLVTGFSDPVRTAWSDLVSMTGLQKPKAQSAEAKQKAAKRAQAASGQEAVQKAIEEAAAKAGKPVEEVARKQAAELIGKGQTEDAKRVIAAMDVLAKRAAKEAEAKAGEKIKSLREQIRAEVSKLTEAQLSTIADVIAALQGGGTVKVTKKKQSPLPTA